MCDSLLIPSEVYNMYAAKLLVEIDIASLEEKGYSKPAGTEDLEELVQELNNDWVRFTLGRPYENELLYKWHYDHSLGYYEKLPLINRRHYILVGSYLDRQKKIDQISADFQAFLNKEDVPLLAPSSPDLAAECPFCTEGSIPLTPTTKNTLNCHFCLNTITITKNPLAKGVHPFAYEVRAWGYTKGEDPYDIVVTYNPSAQHLAKSEPVRIPVALQKIENQD